MAGEPPANTTKRRLTPWGYQMKLKWQTATAAVAFALAGCAPFVPVTNLADVPAEKIQASYRIKTFTVESEASHPEVQTFLGDVTAYSCKHQLYDPPASTGNALSQLRLKALELNADAVIDVTFDTRPVDTFGTNCWQTVQASGMAVKLKK